VSLLRQSAFDGFGKARIQAIVRRVDGPHFERTFFCLLSSAFPLHGVLQSRMETMPGHGVGAGFAGAVMAKQRKTIPARVKVARVIASVYIILSLPCGEQNRQNLARVKYWEIMADNLSKRGWTWAVCQPWIPNGRPNRLNYQ